jgi:hypothetical protein
MKSSRGAASRNIRRRVQFAILAERNGIPAAYTNRSVQRRSRAVEPGVRGPLTPSSSRAADRGAKMDFGMSAWTPRTMSTTWVTRKLTAMLDSA